MVGLLVYEKGNPTNIKIPTHKLMSNATFTKGITLYRVIQWYPSCYLYPGDEEKRAISLGSILLSGYLPNTVPFDNLLISEKCG